MFHIFDRWASVYDLVYSYVRDDIPFYVDEARRSGGPVLELGCGTGRVAVPVAEAGVQIVGLDYSQAMLAIARRKALASRPESGRLALVRADMRHFHLNHRFELVIIPFRGFLSLLTVQDQVRTLVNVREHLVPGGRLVFNIFVPDLDTLVQEGDVAYHYRDVTDPATGTRLVMWQQSRYDNYHQIVNARVIVDELDEQGVVRQRRYLDFPLRYVHRWEMHHLLQLCGFELLDLFGDFDRSAFDESSSEMVWVARVPEARGGRPPY